MSHIRRLKHPWLFKEGEKMLSMIIAMDENRVIGYNNDLPWHLPNDLKRFKNITTGNTIVMGRKTYESIGRALPNRKNIIMTRNEQYQAEGCIVVQSWEELKPYLNEGDVFLIGGAQLIEQFLPYIDRLYLTVIHASFPGDTYLAEIDLNEWILINEEAGVVDEKNKYPHTFYVYDRK